MGVSGNGNVQNATRTLWEQSESMQGSREFDLDVLDADLMMRACLMIVRTGAAFTVGLTSDGGALMVGVLQNGKISRTYFDKPEAANVRMGLVITAGET